MESRRRGGDDVCIIRNGEAAATTWLFRGVAATPWNRDGAKTWTFRAGDADGNPILYPMLKALDVDTVVLVGAWTDYCVAATAMAASDSWGFDCVTVTDAVASANVISDDASHSGLDVTNLFGRNAPSREVLDFLERS